MVDAEDTKAHLSNEPSDALDEEGDLSTLKQEQPHPLKQQPPLKQPGAVLPANGLTQDQAQAHIASTPQSNIHSASFVYCTDRLFHYFCSLSSYDAF